MPCKECCVHTILWHFSLTLYIIKKNCEVGDINSFKSVVQKFIYKNFIYPVFTGCFNRPYSLYYTIIFYDNIMLI